MHPSFLIPTGLCVTGLIEFQEKVAKEQDISKIDMVYYNKGL